jgi:nitrate/nitrite transporter NarK
LSLKVLFDGPADATWLSAREKEILAAELASDRSEYGVRDMPLSETLRNPKVWLLGLAYFGVVYGGYSLTFFLPTMVEGFQHRFGNVFTGWSKTLLTQIPYMIAACVLITVGYLVDKSGKLGKYALLVTFIAAIGAVGANYSTEPYLLVVLLSGVLCASSTGAALVFSVIPKLVDGRGAAASLAIVSSVGISAGFFGPFIMGWLKDLTGGYSVAMWIIAVILIFSGVIIYMIDSSVRKRVGPVIVKAAGSAVGVGVAHEI